MFRLIAELFYYLIKNKKKGGGKNSLLTIGVYIILGLCILGFIVLVIAMKRLDR